MSHHTHNAGTVHELWGQAGQFIDQGHTIVGHYVALDLKCWVKCKNEKC